MIFLGVSTTVGSVNFIVTLLRTRAPGMSINRLPVLVWGTLTASVANILAVPSVSLAFFLLWMDRQFGTHFFDTLQGGQPLLCVPVRLRRAAPAGNIVISRRHGAIAGANPWNAPTQEWSVPPPYNFAVIPSFASRHPL